MKRLFVFALILTLILPCAAVSAESEVTGYNTLYYKEACGLLDAIGIVRITDNHASVNGMTVTRAEMLKYVVDLVHRGSIVISDSAVSRYNDITGETLSYAAFASDIGIQLPAGFEFHPDENADINFSMMLMASAAGYKEASGNYQKIALRLGLTDKLRDEAAQSFSLGDACVMMYNLITTDKIKLVDNKEYLTPLVESMYNLKVCKAQLVGDDGSALYGEPCGKNMLRFKDVKTGEMTELHYEQDASDLMGRRVKIYYDNEDNLIFMCESNRDDIKAEVNGNDIYEFSEATRELSWYEKQYSTRWESGKKIKKIKIPKDSDIIYNGRYTDKHSFVYGLFEPGAEYNIDKVVLVDSNSDSKVDIVKIDAYIPVYVKSINADDFIIKNSLNNTILNLKEDNKTPEVEVYKASGGKISFTEIKSKNAAAVFETIDGEKKWKIIVADSVCEGKLDSISDENGKKILSVDESEFTLSGIMLPFADELVLGQEYTFILDHNGIVCGYEVGVSANSAVGSIVTIKEVKGERKHLEFRIFNSDGSFVTLKNSDTWRVNGSKVKYEIGEIPFITNENGKNTKVSDILMYEMVYYKLDSSGYIKNIFTAKKNPEKGEFGYCSGMNHTETIFTEPAKYNTMYKRSGMYFFPYESGVSNMNFVSVNSATKIMVVPSKNITDDRENYYSVKTSSSLSNDYECTPVAYTFGGTDAVTADYVAIVNESSSDPDSTSTHYIIKNISYGKNSDDDFGYKIDYVTGGGTEGSAVTRDLSFPDYNSNGTLDLGVGDIIKIGFDSLGNASSFILVYDYSEGTVNVVDATYWYSNKRLINGAIYRTSGNMFEYVAGNSISGDPTGKLQIGYATTVIRVEPTAEREDRVKKVTVSDLTGYVEDAEHYSRILYRTSYGETQFLIEYR